MIIEREQDVTAAALAVMRGVNVRARDGALEFGFADSDARCACSPPPNAGPHELPPRGDDGLERDATELRMDAPARAGPSTAGSSAGGGGGDAEMLGRGGDAA